MTVFASLALAEMLAVVWRCRGGAAGFEVLLAQVCNPGGKTYSSSAGMIALEWAAPFMVIALAAIGARKLGWRNVATGLWISVALGVMSTGVIATLALSK